MIYPIYHIPEPPTVSDGGLMMTLRVLRDSLQRFTLACQLSSTLPGESESASSFLDGWAAAATLRCSYGFSHAFCHYDGRRREVLQAKRHTSRVVFVRCWVVAWDSRNIHGVWLELTGIRGFGTR